MTRNIDFRDCFQSDDLTFCEKFNVPFLPEHWQKFENEPTSYACSKCSILVYLMEKAIFFNKRNNKYYCEDCAFEEIANE